MRHGFSRLCLPPKPNTPAAWRVRARVRGCWVSAGSRFGKLTSATSGLSGAPASTQPTRSTRFAHLGAGTGQPHSLKLFRRRQSTHAWGHEGRARKRGSVRNGPAELSDGALEHIPESSVAWPSWNRGEGVRDWGVPVLSFTLKNPVKGREVQPYIDPHIAPRSSLCSEAPLHRRRGLG